MSAGWVQTLGRVAFLNCDPVFHGLEDRYDLLSAPPSWLTGHVLRKDCLLAPIPTADFAQHIEDLMLIPDLGIVSQAEVGSVLLFGDRPVEAMRDIALPSDSSTSVTLLNHLLRTLSLDPRRIVMPPALDTMLERCDGALLIGDRALAAARDHPDLVALDLGEAWLELTATPMVFGVFAAKRDAPLRAIREAHTDLLKNLVDFEEDPRVRNAVIAHSVGRSQMDPVRLDRYYDEVTNRLDANAVLGLETFLRDACGVAQRPSFFEI